MNEVQTTVVPPTEVLSVPKKDVLARLNEPWGDKLNSINQNLPAQNDSLAPDTFSNKFIGYRRANDSGLTEEVYTSTLPPWLREMIPVEAKKVKIDLRGKNKKIDKGSVSWETAGQEKKETFRASFEYRVGQKDNVTLSQQIEDGPDQGERTVVLHLPNEKKKWHGHIMDTRTMVVPAGTTNQPVFLMDRRPSDPGDFLPYAQVELSETNFLGIHKKNYIVGSYHSVEDSPQDMRSDRIYEIKPEDVPAATILLRDRPGELKRLKIEAVPVGSGKFEENQVSFIKKIPAIGKSAKDTDVWRINEARKSELVQRKDGTRFTRKDKGDDVAGMLKVNPFYVEGLEDYSDEIERLVPASPKGSPVFEDWVRRQVKDSEKYDPGARKPEKYKQAIQARSAEEETYIRNRDRSVIRGMQQLSNYSPDQSLSV